MIIGETTMKFEIEELLIKMKMLKIVSELFTKSAIENAQIASKILF
jgi:hypothetical protein